MTLKQAIVKAQPGVGNPDLIYYDDASPTYLVAALAAVDLTSGEQSVIVSGRLASNDGAGGTFVKTPTGALVVDNGVIFASASAAYKWVRVYSGPRNVKWYGAVGNGTTNDSVAVQAAIAALPAVGGALYFPTGNYLADISIPANAINITLTGDASGYPGTPASSINGTITIGNLSSNIQIRDLGIAGAAKGIVVPTGVTTSNLVCNRVSFLTQTNRAVSVEGTGKIIIGSFNDCVFYQTLHGYYSESGAVSNNIHFSPGCIWMNPRDGGTMVYIKGTVGQLDCTNISICGVMNGTATSTCVPIYLGCIGTADLTDLHFADWGDPAVVPSGLPLIQLGSNGGIGCTQLLVRGDFSNGRGPVIDATGGLANQVLLFGRYVTTAGYAAVEGGANITSIIAPGALFGGHAPVTNTPASSYINCYREIGVGTIVVPAGASLVDGETFTLSDGVNVPTVFEFDSGGGVGAGNIAVAFTAGDSADTVRDTVVAAINGVGATLAISATKGGPARVALNNANLATYQQVPISDTVASAGFVTYGMGTALAGNAQWAINGNAPVPITDNHAVLPEEAGSFFLLDKPAGFLVLDLPVATSVPMGTCFTFKLVGTTTGATIRRTSSDTVDRGTSFDMYALDDCVTLVSDGRLCWRVLSATLHQLTPYTQTYNTVSRVVNPASTAAFTGIDNTHVGADYAQLTDLNTLRTDMLMAMQVLNQLIDDLQLMYTLR